MRCTAGARACWLTRTSCRIDRTVHLSKRKSLRAIDIARQIWHSKQGKDLYCFASLKTNTVCAQDNTLRAWDMRPYAPTNRCVKVFTGHMHNFEKNPLKCDWSPDGTKVGGRSLLSGCACSCAHCRAPLLACPRASTCPLQLWHPMHINRVCRLMRCAQEVWNLPPCPQLHLPWVACRRVQPACR